LEWGPRARDLDEADDNRAAALRRFGVPEEDIIALVGRNAVVPEPPEVDPDNGEVLSAFHALSASRPVGFSVAPIPVSEIAAWCDLMQVEDREAFLARIRAADAVWLEWQRKERDDRGH